LGIERNVTDRMRIKITVSFVISIT